MASRSLDDLDSRFRPLVDRLLADAEAVGISLSVICTLRSFAEQSRAVAAGQSQTMNSKHLPQPPEGKSLAVDVVPKTLIKKKYWAPADPLWWKVGEIGRSLGLRWGGMWSRTEVPRVGKVPSYFWDPGHFEMVAREKAAMDPIT